MISIIIPVYNEASAISGFLTHLVANCKPDLITDIIFVDGESTDKTICQINEFVQSYTAKNNFNYKIKVIRSNKGRAVQMNRGAREAKGEILYFLHVDTMTPERFDQYIITEIRNGGNVGCFRMQFRDSHWWLRLISWFSRFNYKSCRGGDQSLFITKSLFEDFGGYDETYRIYEDNEFICRLYKKEKFCVIPKPVKTSSRKYREVGIWRLQYYFLRIHIKRYFGAGPDELYAYYASHVSK